MFDRASIKPLALSEALNWENIYVDMEQNITDSAEEAEEEPPIIATTKIDDKAHTESVFQSAEVQAAALKTPKLSNNQQSKRLLPVSGTAPSQKKKVWTILLSLHN